MSKSICIMIGNSDDKLSQFDWYRFCEHVDKAVRSVVRYNGTHMHGRFFSLPNEMWQSACWCIEVDDECAFVLAELREQLAKLAHEFGQDSIAWVEGPGEMIRAAS